MSKLGNQIGHFETIIPHFFRTVKGVNAVRERVDTPDGDFIDIDWIDSTSSTKLLILSHGLEGTSGQAYIMGMAKYFSQRGWSICAWNYRGCSGEINRLPRFYHSGDIEDLEFVVNHARKQKRYSHIGLIGFSLGGNITLKYLGDRAQVLPKEIVGGCVYSVPCHLSSGAKALGEKINKIYEQNFLFTMKKKIIKKKRLGQLREFNLKKILFANSIIQFDNLVTAPLHGFLNSAHYYKQCSSIFSIPNINVPTRIVNALNDPILSQECYPYTQVKSNKNVELKTPSLGGHVGFIGLNLNSSYTSELKAYDFFEKHIEQKVLLNKVG